MKRTLRIKPKVKTNQNPHKQKQQRAPRVVSLGSVDLQYTLHISKSDLMNHGVEFDKLEKVTDLSFLSSKKELWDNIQISSQNYLINFLLFINKANSTKSFIELIMFNSPKYSQDEMFLKEILTHVTEHNYLFLNEASVSRGTCNLSFAVKSGEDTKTFTICNDSNNEEIKNQEEDNSKDKEEENLLTKHIKCDYTPFDYFLYDFEEFFLTNEHLNISIKDLKEYFTHVKSHKNLKLVVNFTDVIKNMSKIDASFLETIRDILCMTEISVFEKKDTLGLFNLLNSQDGEKEIDEREIHDYFLNKILKNNHSTHHKTGVFLNGLNKISFVEVKGKNGETLQKEYDVLIHPKINHTNQKLIEEYKKLTIVNYAKLRSVFFGSLFGKSINSKHKGGLKKWYPSYLVGTESAKKILQIFKEKSEMPTDQSYYEVKLPKSFIEKEVQVQDLKTKEEKFVLDCNNVTKSTLRYYNPLFDGHLNSFFASEVIRKDLKNKGFINTNGFIKYDPVYRSVLGPSPARKKSPSKESDKNLEKLNVLPVKLPSLTTRPFKSY